VKEEISLSEAARISGIHKATVWVWAQTDPAFPVTHRFGPLVLVNRREFLEYIAANRADRRVKKK